LAHARRRSANRPRRPSPRRRYCTDDHRNPAHVPSRFDPARRRFLAIREDHSGEGEPRAAIVDIALDGERPPRVLYDGPDFLAAPRPSPDGRRLAWLEWDHPDMPWDATRLRVAPFVDDGGLGPSDLAAGGIEESIAQPEWAPDGILHFVSDRTGWWNIYRLAPGPRLEALSPIEAEFADPAWVFDRSSYGFLPGGSIVAVGRARGRDRLFHISPDETIGEVSSPYTEIGTIRVGTGGIVANVGTPTVAPTVVSIEPSTLATSGVLTISHDRTCRTNAPGRNSPTPPDVKLTLLDWALDPSLIVMA